MGCQADDEIYTMQNMNWPLKLEALQQTGAHFIPMEEAPGPSTLSFKENG